MSDITVILYFPQHHHSLLSNDIRNNIASLHGRFTNIIIIYHFLPRIFSKAILTFYRKYFHVIFVISNIFESLDKSFSFQLITFSLLARKFYLQKKIMILQREDFSQYYDPPFLPAWKYAPHQKSNIRPLGALRICPQSSMVEEE